jgi:hypothetical protein
LRVGLAAFDFLPPVLAKMDGLRLLAKQVLTQVAR